MNAKEFKENFDLKEYVRKNIDHNASGDNIYINCPFHTEKTPSCVVNKDSVYCFGACGMRWDSIDVLKELTGFSFKTILEMNFDDYKVINNIKPLFDKKQDKPLTASLIENYNKRLLRKPEKLEYLYNRGFDLESIKLSRIGYGIPLDVYGITFNNPRYVIPHYDENNNLCGAKYRIDPLYAKIEEQKYISHPGTNGKLYNIGVLNNNTNIVYVGSQFDAAVLWFRYNIAAVCPPSENTFKDEWIPLFMNKHVIIWLDNDKTGRDSSLKVYQKIRNICHANIFTWDTNHFSVKDDFTDYLIKYGIDRVKNIICELQQN